MPVEIIECEVSEAGVPLNLDSGWSQILLKMRL